VRKKKLPPIVRVASAKGTRKKKKKTGREREAKTGGRGCVRRCIFRPEVELKCKRNKNKKNNGERRKNGRNQEKEGAKKGRKEERKWQTNRIIK